MSPETNAKLQQLRHSSAVSQDALSSLLDKGEALDEVAEIIEDKIRSGSYILNDHLTRLLANVRRQTLYDLVKEQLFEDRFSLINIYLGGVPDPNIELKVIQHLYQTAEDDTDPSRRMAAEAIRDVGTIDTLPALEGILYDLAPTQSTKKVIANLLFDASNPTLESFLANAVSESRREFVQTLIQAIKEVKERNSKRINVLSEGIEAPSVLEGVVENAQRELKSAREKVQNDPVYSLVCIRRGAEAMGKHVYRRLGLENGGKPAGKMMLNDLLHVLNKENKVPMTIIFFLQAIQPFGNYVAHDQDDQFSNITTNVGIALIMLFEEALLVYENWLRETTSD